MTREQIDALSDDPDEMAQQLQDLAGGNAVIRVDSFEGGRLPPKSAIKAIHITRDAFAAENHYAGGLFIDIITQPGIGPLRTNLNMRRARRLAERQEPARRGEGTRTHAELQRRAVWLVDQAEGVVLVQREHADEFRDAGVVRPAAGRLLDNSLGPRRPTDNVFLFGLFDYAITRDQTIRVNFNRNSVEDPQPRRRRIRRRGARLLERGSRQLPPHPGGRADRPPVLHQHARATSAGPTSSNRSVFEGRTIRILDESTTGGQQLKGGTHRKTINLQSDLDYVRGIHSVRTGLQVEGGTYHSDDSARTTSAPTRSRASTPSGREPPRSFTRRTGDPVIDYKNIQAGMYLQDDIRVRKNLHVQPRPPLRAADAPERREQLRTALWHHLVAGQERQDDPARQRRHLLRLAVDRHVRADAARGWLPAAGGEHHRSGLPRTQVRRGPAHRRTATCSATTCGCSASRG